MTSYSLAEMARERGIRRRTIVLRPITPSLAAEWAYRRVLFDMLDEAEAYVGREVVPAVEAEHRDLRTKGIGDRFETVFSAMRSFFSNLVGTATRLAGDIFRVEADRHTERFAATVKDAIGIDIGNVLRSANLEDAMSLVTRRNAALITSISTDLSNRIAQATYDNLQSGGSVKALRERLQTEYGFPRKRAQLIARDQTAKITSNLNRIRQEQAGVTAYKWSSSRDERVRTLHRQLDGTEHKWAEPGPAEQGGHPGEPIQCRCIARAVISLD